MLHEQVQICYYLMKRVAFCLLGRTRTISYRYDFRVLLIEGYICKTRTGTFETLANSADLDQTLQNAASDQGLHNLLKLEEEGLNETV